MMVSAFLTPLPTDYESGDPDLPGAVNDITSRLNTIVVDGERSSVRDLRPLVPATFDSGATNYTCMGIKQGILIAIRFRLTIGASWTGTELNILEGMPAPWQSPQAGTIVGLSPNRFNNNADFRIISDGQRYYLRRPDGGSFTLTAGSDVRGSFLTWSNARGVESEQPGNPL